MSGRERERVGLAVGFGRGCPQSDRLAGADVDAALYDRSYSYPGALQVLDDGDRRASAVRGLADRVDRGSVRLMGAVKN